MKAGMPAQYGGRISSLLDIHLKEGGRWAGHGKIGLGLLISRLLIEGPLVQEKTSLLLAVRFSYWGLLAARRDPEGLKSYQNYWLYDLNGKIAITLPTSKGWFLASTTDWIRRVSSLRSRRSIQICVGPMALWALIIWTV